MTCDDVTDLYLLSLRGKLSPEDAETLHNHVSACGICSTTIPLDKAIISAVQNIPEAEPRENIVSEICRELFEQKEFINFSFRHMLLFSLGLATLFVGTIILWKDLRLKAFAYIHNQILVYLMQARENIQDAINFSSTATSYKQTIATLPYHLSWAYLIIFAGSLLFLVSLLFSFNLYPIRKSSKNFNV